MILSLLLGLFLFPLSLTHAQQANEGPARVKDAVRAARLAKTEQAREQAYQRINASSMQDDDDIKDLYDELATFPLEASQAKIAKRQLKTAQRLAGILSESGKGAHHAVMGRLLEIEATGLPNNYMGPWGAANDADGIRETLRFGRYQALVTAAGEGKNELALPALHRLRKKGGEAGKSAEFAIGQIGKDEDLNEFISEIKNNPRARVVISGFGKKGYERVLGEIENVSVSDDEKMRLAGALPPQMPREVISRVQALTNHTDPRIAKIAARALSGSVGAGDDVVIQGLLSSPDRAVQDEGLDAIGSHWDVKHLPYVLKILQSDPEPFRRSIAASILGQHKVVQAEPDLRAALLNDPDPNVRKSAAFALKRMGRQ